MREPLEGNSRAISESSPFVFFRAGDILKQSTYCKRTQAIITEVIPLTNNLELDEAELDEEMLPHPWCLLWLISKKHTAPSEFSLEVRVWVLLFRTERDFFWRLKELKKRRKKWKALAHQEKSWDSKPLLSSKLLKIDSWMTYSLFILPHRQLQNFIQTSSLRSN